MLSQTQQVSSGVSEISVSTHSTIQIEVIEGTDAIARAGDAWLKLERHRCASTPFQSYAVASACFAAHRKRQAVPRIIVMRKRGLPIIVLPTVVTQLFGFSIVRFLGDPLIQYGDLLADGTVARSDIEAAIAVAADPKVACLALFRRVRDDSRMAPVLSRLANKVTVEESPLVDLLKPSILSSRDQREQRRQRRRLSERGVTDVRFLTASDAQPYLAEAFQLKRAWIDAHGFESAVVGNPDWERAMHNVCGSDESQLIAGVLTCAGRTAAIEIAFVNSDGWFGFLGAFAPEFASMGPGQILATECMQWARRQGLVTFDQLPPAQDYKRRHATHAVSVRDYAVCLRSHGKLPLVITKMIPTLKGVLAKLPAGARSALIKLSGH